jgi:uncharacterized membrane protein YczE
LILSGTFIASLGYLVTVAAHVGNGPLFAVQDGLHRRFSISLSLSALIVGLLLVGIATTLGGPLGIGTVAVPVLGSAWIAVLEPYITQIDGTVQRWAAFLFGTTIMMFGAVLGLGASLGASAMDAVMLGLSERIGRPPGTTRIMMELFLSASGALIGGAVGLGTLVMGAMVGPVFQMWSVALERVGLPLPKMGASALHGDGRAPIAASVVSE